MAWGDPAEPSAALDGPRIERESSLACMHTVRAKCFTYTVVLSPFLTATLSNRVGAPSACSPRPKLPIHVPTEEPERFMLRSLTSLLDVGTRAFGFIQV